MRDSGSLIFMGRPDSGWKSGGTLTSSWEEASVLLFQKCHVPLDCSILEGKASEIKVVTDPRINSSLTKLLKAEQKEP